MPQPPQYNRLYNLTEYATANPSDKYNAAYVDAELNGIEATLDQALINLTLIQRDDGALKNQVVTADSLSTSVTALMAMSGVTVRGAWLTATAYAAKDLVTQGGSTYICAVAHTSGTFATDLTAVKWLVIDTSSGAIAASAITNTPAGGIEATNVQAALNELDTEKLAKASNLSDVASVATAFANIVAPGGTVTGALTMSGVRFNEAKGADIASASTINLDAASGNVVDVTGTTSITAVTLSEGREAWVRFTGVLTLTNGASLVLPGGANITTSVGDFATFRGYAAGVVRCVAYAKASGQSVIATASFASFSASVAASALTVTLGAGVPLQFSDGTVASSPALTLVVSSGSTLGTTNGVASRLWVVAIKNGGTPELAIINTWDGANIYEIVPTDLVTTTAEGGAGAADSAQVFYSTTLRSSQIIAIVGYIEITQATAGAWVTSPSIVQGWGPGIALPGQRVQMRRKVDGAVATGSTATPNDDTAPGPQITEGNEFITLAITPKSSLNLLHWRHQGVYANATAATSNILSFFNTDLHATNAQAVTVMVISPGGVGIMTTCEIEHRHVAGLTSATTGRIRAGNATGTTTTFNGSVGARFHAGLMASFLEVSEIQR